MSTSKRKTYHHGDLRNTLIEAGVRMLAQDGIDQLSLRKLAKVVGVSHNAPYQHFTDKEALLAAIAFDGFQRLQNAVEHAIQQREDSPTMQLYATSVYIRFALDHPHHFQLMFQPYDADAYPHVKEAALGALEQIESIIRDGQGQGAFIEGDSRQLATLVWVTMHGAASILIAGRLPLPLEHDADIDALATLYISQLLGGIQR